MAALVVAAVAGSVGVASGTASQGRPGAVPTALRDQFAAAAEEFHVPLDVLLAVSYQESRWDAHQGRPSTTGNYNVMGLTHVDPGDLARPSAAEKTRDLDGRGDGGQRPAHPSKAALAAVDAVRTTDPALHTLDEAARLIGRPAAELRTDTRQSVRGGAALLARYERQAAGALPADPGRWYAAIARYSQSPDTAGARQFADRVYDSIRQGRARTTDDGQTLTLPARPHLTVERTTPPAAGSGHTAKRAMAAKAPADPTPTPECPSGLACDFVPAAYAQTDPNDKSKYGDYDIANRPADGDAIRYIVIHDTEGGYDGSVQQFQDPTAASSTHYLIRSNDGLVTQMVPTADMPWHAGNKYLNMHSIGVEHEGYAISGASWYTESEYQSSAALVKYLAARFGVPLDREHVIGHDDVPGPLDAYVAGMHWDPGPFWDWNHYMALLGAPGADDPAGAPLTAGERVRLDVPFTTANEPVVTDCTKSCTQVPAQPANFVYLRTAPSDTAPLLTDAYLHPDGSAGTTDAADWSDKAVTGTSFVVADQQGDWTAIWYGGRKAWFANPGGAYTVPVSGGGQQLITPRAGATSIPVYGRAYPDASAYPSTIQPQPVTALTKYSIPAGQVYVADATPVTGDFYNAINIDGSAPGDRTLVTGTTTYYSIRYDHRIAYVKAADVQTVPAVSPRAASSR